MIKEHQPTIFDSTVRIAFSSKADGTMATGGGATATSDQVQRSRMFLQSKGFSTDQFTGIFVRYGDDKKYRSVTRATIEHTGEIIETDAIWTTLPNTPILLPVADCVATVVHDPVTGLLAVLHLGRHASAAHLIEAFYQDVTDAVGSKASDWKVWMSPSLQATHNTLEYFTPDSPGEWKDFMYTDEAGKIHIDIAAHNKHRFQLLGVKKENIEICNVDTYTDERYFSHRAANELAHTERQGRMVVAAEINAQHP